MSTATAMLCNLSVGLQGHCWGFLRLKYHTVQELDSARDSLEDPVIGVYSFQYVLWYSATAFRLIPLKLNL